MEIQQETACFVWQTGVEYMLKLHLVSQGRFSTVFLPQAPEGDVK
jgi:hypothetical protein